MTEEQIHDLAIKCSLNAIEKPLSNNDWYEYVNKVLWHYINVRRVIEKEFDKVDQAVRISLGDLAPLDETDLN